MVTMKQAQEHYDNMSEPEPDEYLPVCECVLDDNDIEVEYHLQDEDVILTVVLVGDAIFDINSFAKTTIEYLKQQVEKSIQQGR